MFGDVVSQHGDWIWLGSIIEVCKEFGFSERLVRTSVFRLVKDDWLTVNKIGRKSYYRFTDSANNHYTKAARRIYSSSNIATDGQWLLLFPSFVDEKVMPNLKRQLKWLGFSALTSGGFAHPNVDQKSLDETILELKLSDSVVIFKSELIDQSSEKVLKNLVFEKWNLKELQIQYQNLIKVYQSILNNLKTTNHLKPQQSFLLRCLVIHEYRRILLKDHELPLKMLPEDWFGNKANQLVKEIYQLVANSSCVYITNELKTFDGTLSKSKQSFNQRFIELLN